MRIFLLLTLLVVSFVARAADNVSPIGNWIELDAGTKKPRSVIQVSEDAEHVVSGKVLKMFNPAENKTMCSDCPEDFKNKPVVGMQILWGLQQASDYTWNAGHILSPKRGQVFDCNMTLSQDGQTLTVRVYSRSARLGQTQTWYRAAS